MNRLMNTSKKIHTEQNVLSDIERKYNYRASVYIYKYSGVYLEKVTEDNITRIR